MVPVVNQVEVHPFYTNEDVRAANRRHGVLTEAWSPIAKGKVVDDDTIGEIASLVGRTPAQVTLRWHVQRGDIVFPKSMNPDRMRQNFEIFDFELEPGPHVRHRRARPRRGRPDGPEPRHVRLDPLSRPTPAERCVGGPGCRTRHARRWRRR